MSVQRNHHAEIQFDWDARGKKWRVTFIVTVGKSAAVHWRWIDSSSPVDTESLRLLIDALEREMASWLF